MTSIVVNPDLYLLGGAWYRLCGQRLIKTKGLRNGDTKQGVSGTLVFRDGYWRKQESLVGANSPTQLKLLPDDSDTGVPMEPPMNPRSAFDWIEEQDIGLDTSTLFYRLADLLHLSHDEALEMTDGVESPYGLAGAAVIKAPLSNLEKRFAQQAKSWNQRQGNIFDNDEFIDLFGFWRVWIAMPMKDFQEALDSDRLLEGIAEIVGEDRVEQACIMLEWA